MPADSSHLILSELSITLIYQQIKGDEPIYDFEEEAGGAGLGVNSN